MSDKAPPDRLKALKALAEHPNTPPHEAAVAREKLRRLMAQCGISEAEISDDAEVSWTGPICTAGEKALWEAVVSMILDTVSLPMRWMRLTGRGRSWMAEVKCRLIDKADIMAAYRWYRDYLVNDTQRLTDEVKRRKADIARLEGEIKTRRAAVKELPDLMISKYMIFPPSIIAAVESELAKSRASEGGEPHKPRKLTRQELKKMMDRQDRRSVARSAMSNGDAWQKGAGLAGAQRELTFN